MNTVAVYGEACLLIHDQRAVPGLWRDALEFFHHHRAEPQIGDNLLPRGPIGLRRRVAQDQVVVDVRPMRPDPLLPATDDGRRLRFRQRQPLPCQIPLPGGRLELQGIAERGARMAGLMRGGARGDDLLGGDDRVSRGQSFEPARG
jgi:hypothetical protein